MRRIHLEEDIKPVTEFRAKTASLIEQVRETKRVLVLTQRGRSAAVVVDVGEYQRMVEELELLRDIHTAEKQLAEGLGIEHEQARQQVVREKETLQLAELVTLEPDEIPDVYWLQLDNHFTSDQVVELITLIGFFNMINRFILTLDIEPDPQFAVQEG